MGLRFTLSHPVTAAIPPGDAELFKIALDLRNALTPLPLTKSEMADLKAKAASGSAIV